jgi:hypothetical protein
MDAAVMALCPSPTKPPARLHSDDDHYRSVTHLGYAHGVPHHQGGDGDADFREE